jgi:hypothetical protein
VTAEREARANGRAGKEKEKIDKEIRRSEAKEKQRRQEIEETGQTILRYRKHASSLSRPLVVF